MQVFFDCMNDAEQIIDGSEFKYLYILNFAQTLLPIQLYLNFPGLQHPISKTIYKHAIEFLEKYTKILFFGSLKVLQSNDQFELLRILCVEYG